MRQSNLTKYCIKLLTILTFVGELNAKYVEGYIKTLEDWAFVARFCFISGRGRYEYLIEYERKYGELQLLLYYDDKTQWPAVYKSDKTCKEKLSVLSVPDNQIVTLSARSPYNHYSGCTLRSSKEPEFNEKTTQSPNRQKDNKPNKSSGNDPDASYFDQFLVTSTSTYSNIEFNARDFDNMTTESNFMFNETDIFNSTLDLTNFSYSSDMERFDNNLENSTEFRDEVEQLFDENELEQSGNGSGNGRIRRSIPKLYDSDKRGTVIVSCRNVGSFTSSRERWWYIAIANCGSIKGLDVKYRFRMTNGNQGDLWHEHFSADEMYIPPILLAENIAYTFLLLATFLCAIELKSRHLYHCTYRLFTLSALLQWFGILLQGVTWAKYAVSGLGPHTAIGGVFMGASEISFLTLLLLMAKGYTITRARLSTCSTVKITVFVNAYIVVYICLYIFQAQAFDPGEVLNLYESPAGFGLSGLRCIAWGVFLCSCGATIKKYPEKGAFYYPFGLLGSLWILSGPMLIFVGVGVLDAWVRESVMCGALGTIAFGGHVAFLWLTWPSRANKSFPYHVRTNHVGISNDEGTDYPRHTYEPTMPEQNVIIPLSRRTEELLSGVYNQYLRERELYNTATPPSHISFPITNESIRQQPTAPVASNSSVDSDDTYLGATEDPANPEVFLYANQSIHQNNQENDHIEAEQVDSGHPSFETTTSPNGTNSPPSIQPHSQQLSSERIIPTDEIGDNNKPTSATSSNILKNNPFIVGQRPPNKVILEPIEHPIIQNGVPKHLFAVKKRPSLN